jgi:hypothetical protein
MDESAKSRLRSVAVTSLFINLAAVIALVGCGSDKSSGPNTADTIPPAAVRDLRVEAAGCDNVSLAWTAPGDDSASGNATSYDLRYATETITVSNWASATQCQSEPAPKAAGQADGLVVSGLSAGTTYYFALMARDESGNASGISNNTSAAAGSTTIAWVHDGVGADQAWVASTSTLSANWAGACATDYEYALGTTQSGTDVVGWTSSGNVTHIDRTDLSLVEGETYYWVVRAVLDAARGTEVSSDGVTIDTQPPTSAVAALAATTNAISFAVGWVGSDATSGVSRYDIQVKDGEGPWGDWLGGTTLSSDNCSGSADHCYYFRSRAYDRAGNVEAYPASPDAWTVVTCSYAYAAQWGDSGTAEGQFQFPEEIAIDAAGEIYVADQSNFRIQVFNSAGGFLRAWGEHGAGSGQLRMPVAVAVDDSGYVYVTDFDNTRIEKFTSVGGFVTEWGQWGTAEGEFHYPRGLAIDDSFHVYVADAGNNRIQKFTSDGTFLMTWGTSGNGDGELYGVMDVAVGPAGTIFAVDSYNDRIQEFTSSGVYLNKWGSYGTGDGLFEAAACIAVDDAGHVYVTETNGNRVQRFTAAGGFLTKWGSQGQGEGQFSYAKGIAVATDGSVYVTDFGNCRIEKFTAICP